MRKYIHVDRVAVELGHAVLGQLPLVVLGKQKLRARYVKIHGPCEVIYDPDKPLRDGARVWIETKARVTIKC